MAIKVGADSAGVASPNFHALVPTSGDDDWGWSGRESDTGNPFGVSVLNDGELALTKSVPQLDSSVTRPRDDLSVVRREGNREHVLGVTNEAASAFSSGNLPQTKSAVPRARESKLAINAGNNVRDKVVVATESATSITIVTLFTSDGPNNERLIKITKTSY